MKTRRRNFPSFFHIVNLLLEVVDALKSPINMKGDRLNMLLIFVMFIVEGVVQGVVSAIPIVLENRKVSFQDQGEFSITAWPLCLKLPWAPVIDCVYSKKFGRRKTWLIPIQYLMGLTLLFASMNLDDWLGSEDGTRLPNVHMLSAIFCVAVFLNSLQAICLDGWTLTMLQKRNLGYAAMCQNAGGLTGFIIAYVLFIILDSKDFCNKFRTVPQENGFLSSADFLLFWSIVFFLWTTMILILIKKENNAETTDHDEDEIAHSLTGSYELMWRILNVRPLIITSLILLTCFIGSGPFYGVALLKIIDAGMPREDLVLLSLLALPLQLIWASVVGKWLTGPRAFRSFLIVQILQLIIASMIAVVLFVCSNAAKSESGLMPDKYYWTICFLFIIRRLTQYSMDVALAGFGCRVSDPRYGGIYLTLLWSMYGIGASWPTTLSLYCVDWLTIKTCAGTENENCTISFDGYYAETILFGAVGGLWLLGWCRKEIIKLENLEASAWIVEKKHEVVKESTIKNFTIQE